MMMIRVKAARVSSLLVAFALLSGLAGACEDSSLSGSLTDYYNTDFDRVRARLYSSELTIEYVRETGEVPVRVSLRRGDAGIGTGSHDLTTRGGVTGRSGDMDIPPFISGQLQLDDFSAKPGAAVKGEFTAKFQTGKDELSLSGSFSTKLEVVERVEGYEVDGYPPEPEVEELEDEELEQD
ncbi:MAG: hypothetical protein RBU37_08390 [Myxococcota bacterium]|nr:hypothetical protein [Myxococcota bacterium]